MCFQNVGRGFPGLTNGMAARVVVETLAIDDDLHEVWVVEIGRVFDLSPECSDSCLRSIEHEADGGIDRVWRNQRLVALHVHDEFGWKFGGDFGEPIGGGLVVVAGHDGDAAEAIDGFSDAFVIGRDEIRVHAARLFYGGRRARSSSGPR